MKIVAERETQTTRTRTTAATTTTTTNQIQKGARGTETIVKG